MVIFFQQPLVMAPLPPKPNSPVFGWCVITLEEGLDLVEEFYSDENSETEQQLVTTAGTKAKPKFNQGEGFVQDIQKGLQQHVRAVNQMNLDNIGFRKILLDCPMI